jgi:hypothetical protein
MREKPTRTSRRDLLKIKLATWTVAVHCAPVATGVFMVSSV